MKDKKMLYGIGIVFLFLATIGFSYAYFTASIANKDVKDQVVQTGTLELTYTDGPEIKMENIKPGQTITKKVTVKNTGTLDASYNFVWQELNNTITNDEMVISSTCKRLNGEVEEEACEGVDETPIKRIKIKENVSIEPGITHEYNVTITFKEENADQNYNQGKLFTGVLGIKEYKTPETINCTFDGELTKGAEYTNGKYTYRYMQEQNAYLNIMSYRVVYEWKDITTDGWGVTLTDKDSTEPVTSKICTTINNKPVVSTAYMYYNSQATSIDLDTFDTSNVIDMKNMFNTTNFKTLDLSNFDTSNVTNMSRMFEESKTTALDVSNFNTSSVTDMSFTFYNSKAALLDLKSFNTSNVTTMNHMFGGSTAATIDLSSFDTSNVTNMSNMFWNNNAAMLDLKNFNTSNVTDMSSMFLGFEATIPDLSSFDTSNVTDMSSMFSHTGSTIPDLSNFNTSNVTTMSNMFRESEIKSIDLSSFDTSNVTDMGQMFEDCKNLKTIYVSDKFITTKVTNDYEMFIRSKNLVGGSGTTYDSTKTDKTYARIDGGVDSPGYFTSKN